jgi:hypothetical protein
MVFNKYKTFKEYGQQKFFLSVRTDKTIRTIIKNRISDGLLVEGKPIYSKQERQFLRDINSITKEVFDIVMNVQDIRVIYNTKKFRNIKIAIGEDSKKMGHSLLTKLNNYIR